MKIQIDLEETEVFPIDYTTYDVDVVEYYGTYKVEITDKIQAEEQKEIKEDVEDG